jgi:hypothetical protein
MLAHRESGASSDLACELDPGSATEFAVDVTGDAERAEIATAALASSGPLTRLPAPRIDQSGLVALARRAQEQAQQQPTNDPLPGASEGSATGAVRHLLAPRRSDLSIVPPRRRTA